MRILRVTSLGHIGTGSGGIETSIMLIDPVLEQMGHNVRTLASDAGKGMPSFSSYSFKALSSQPLFLRLLYRAFYPDAFRALRQALARYQPDIVQLHSLYEISPSVLFALRDQPTVLTVHGAEDYTKELLLWGMPIHFFRHGQHGTRNFTVEGWIHYLYHRLISMSIYRIGFRFVNQFVVVSEYMQNLLERDGIKSVCIRNATRLYPPAPLDCRRKCVLYVGRLEMIKGVQYLIAAFKLIHHQYPDATLRIAGSGGYEAELCQYACNLLPEGCVTFVGHRKREELYEEYSQASIVVVPSVWPEPFGKVGIEAMSVGRPVIASDVGGISEWLVHGVTGFLVPPADPPACAEAISRLFEDGELMVRMAEAALKHAQNFSIEAHTEQIIQLYNKVLGKNSARSTPMR